MSFSWVFIVLFFLLGFSFLLLWKKFPQTIWFGITFLGVLLSLLAVLIVFLVEQNLRIPLMLLGISLVVAVFLVPVLMIATFIFSGVKMIQIEGFKLKNMLSLILGIGMVVYLLGWPFFIDLNADHILNIVYQFIGFCALYFSSLLFLYTLTNSLNLLHFDHPHIDYFIVLGAALEGDQVTPLLAGRINKALELQEKQKSGKIVFSGGQGDDEWIPEGEAMMNYALDKDVELRILLKEIESTSTAENIHFSKEIIDTDWTSDKVPQIALVTNNYHVLRALIYARKQGINGIGFGSESTFYYSLNAFVREFVAYLQMTYKVHGAIIGLIGLKIFLFILSR